MTSKPNDAPFGISSALISFLENAFNNFISMNGWITDLVLRKQDGVTVDRQTDYFINFFWRFCQEN